MLKRFRSLRIMSSFAFENSNGYLKNFVHGTNHPEFQIYSSTSLFLSYQTIKKMYLKPRLRVKLIDFSVMFQIKIKLNKKIKIILLKKSLKQHNESFSQKNYKHLYHSLWILWNLRQEYNLRFSELFKLFETKLLRY